MVKLNNQNILNNVENSFQKTSLPNINVGDNVKIGVIIQEEDKKKKQKKRIQFYQGSVISKKNSSINKMITVRKILQGIGVERIFLVNSPKIDSISILNCSKVRRSKLYYIRHLKGKATRLKKKN